MKRVKLILAGLALVLAFAAPVMAGGSGYCCPPAVPDGSADVKYYQDQTAGSAVGVTNTCYSERAVFHSDKVAVNVDAQGFGAMDHVGCIGVLGVGQVKISADLTTTNTCGSYDIHQVSTMLSNSTTMNQLGGIAATATGAAQAGGTISQSQTLTSGGFAALPGGCAYTSYCGTQSATVQASAH